VSVPLGETDTAPPTSPGTLAPEETPATTAPTTTSPSVVGRELGTLVGQGRNRELAVENVRAEDCIAKGDPVLTSGIRESLFPSGIPVGEVTRAERRIGSLELDVRVKPYADLDRLYFVKVLLYDGDAVYAEG
jgi:cell shape-determining protein MreC